MKEKIRVGIFGGTFNPPHIAHVNAAECFLGAARLDSLLIIPALVPPHKEYSGTVTPNDRLEMCRLAFSDLRGTEISDIEISRGAMVTHNVMNSMDFPSPLEDADTVTA